MEYNSFFPPRQGVTLSELAAHIGAELSDNSAASVVITGVAPIARAQPGEVCYVLSRRNRDELKTCNASAIICDESLSSIMPEGVPLLLTARAHTAFAVAGAYLYESAMRPAVIGEAMISPQAFIDPTAVLEDGVHVEPFATIGPHAEIGRGTRVGASAVIGEGVRIGRNCTISPNVSVLCAYIGDHVILHPGARIGQDGFGYAPGPRGGMIKIVQIGRVIIQDHVEIGANTTIDRGTMDDTVIGEGTKIDNQVQIGHNVQIGRSCGIVAKVAIAGSTRIGNGVMIGGAAAINGHISLGDGVQIAAMSGVVSNVPAGEKYGGIPARPMRDFLRDIAEIAMRSSNKSKKTEGRND
ncbi:UDP-3-O-(3-hydroxymyristoyl)glucosamine N-acyltransferase [Rhizobium sp. CFBP 8762]|uniref:UDP-3-O-(3-hydroxymyristoyl)glucosamine N-acyltransferase n=1 Tax=Rhizobium sp. CFBP 8762 TaxID=2775279 RepID=UPI0017869224|nr:UDP-3-O-(3-hydroxymyristoyl)glucosamine N-acyltransferase [Rhizobium sp. CFBP 8762]MBD8555756.1 UDP-3-O-(3-hydroxymyristoyl)glucosamine N-acyltransferase [Rhizobium sp. CFBP 8762]